MLAVPSAAGERPREGPVLVQLSGVPGSGKSTLARALAHASDLVVIDTDVLKSALLSSRVEFADAGPATYAASLALAEDLLAQGRSVVLDSPCRYVELLRGGERVAQRAGAPYGFIELWADEPSALLQRLDGRTPRVSQVASSTGAVPGTNWEFGTADATLRAWQGQLVRPEHGWLRLDATRETQGNLRSARRYLDDLRRP